MIQGLCAAAVAALCAGALAGCAGDGLTGGIAATVNGVEIQEDEITQDIQTMREKRMMTTESSWGEWLAEYSYLPTNVRDDYLDTYIDNEVLRQEAATMEIAVESSEIDDYVNQMSSRYESPEKWHEALDEVGMTEEDYREKIEVSLLKQRVEETLPAIEPSAENDPLIYAQENLSTFDGVKRASHILFEAGDEATAQEVLDKLRSGELDFAEAAKTYSTDTGSGAEGGDVGWGAPLNSFVEEFQQGLDGLQLGQISDLVTSQFGTHIIKCTDVFNAPASLTSLDQLPEEFSEYAENQVAANETETPYEKWLKEKREAADIVTNPMPENVPYNVDMSKYMDAETLESLKKQAEEEEEEFVEGEEAQQDGVDAAAEEVAGDGSGDGTIQLVDDDGNPLEQPADGGDNASSDQTAEGGDGGSQG